MYGIYDARNDLGLLFLGCCLLVGSNVAVDQHSKPLIPGYVFVIIK